MSDRSNQSLSPAQLTEVLTSLPAGVKVNVEKLSTGDLSLSVVDTPAPTKADLIAAKYAHLRGVGITLSQAAEKYGVPRGAMEKWVYISRDVHFADELCYPKLVNEAEVALCADIYHERRKVGTAGLPYFDAEGRVITEVKRPASSRKKQTG